MNRRIKYYDSILDNNSHLLSLALVYYTSILHDVSRNIYVEFPSADVGPRGSKVSYRRGMGNAVCLVTYNVSYIIFPFPSLQLIASVFFLSWMVFSVGILWAVFPVGVLPVTVILWWLALGHECVGIGGLLSIHPLWLVAMVSLLWLVIWFLFNDMVVLCLR